MAASPNPSYVLERVTRLQRPPTASAPFWPEDVRELLIEVFSRLPATAPPSKLEVYGVDPRQTSSLSANAIVFFVEVTAAQLTALIARIDGSQPFKPTPGGKDGDGNTMTTVDLGATDTATVIGGDGPGGRGPNLGVVITTAVAVAANIALANAALSSRTDPKKPR